MKGNCRKKNLTTSERKISSYKPAFRNFAKFTGKHLCQSLSFLIKLQAAATLLKKRLLHRCFSVNFAKFLRTPFLIEHLWWLLLVITTLLLNKIYSSEEIRIWWNGNFLSLDDFLLNLTTVIYDRQVWDLNLHRLLPYY